MSRVKARIAVEGQHEHTALNPHGLIYRVACYAEAEGCGAQGLPTTYWTWFPGYAWEVAYCKRCSEHVGWRFSSEEALFWGLIVDKLAED